MQEGPTAINNPAQRPPMKPARAALFTAVVVVGVAFYVIGSGLLGITSMFGGFVFSIYWLMIKHGSFAEFLPGVVGALTGIALGWFMMMLPTWFDHGVATALVIGVSIATVFILIGNYLPFVLNMAFVIFLTLSTIPKLQNAGDLWLMACSTAFGAAYLFAIRGIVSLIASSRRNRAEAAVA